MILFLKFNYDLETDNLFSCIDFYLITLPYLLTNYNSLYILFYILDYEHNHLQMLSVFLLRFHSFDLFFRLGWDNENPCFVPNDRENFCYNCDISHRWFGLFCFFIDILYETIEIFFLVLFIKSFCPKLVPNFVICFLSIIILIWFFFLFYECSNWIECVYNIKLLKGNY